MAAPRVDPTRPGTPAQDRNRPGPLGTITVFGAKGLETAASVVDRFELQEAARVVLPERRRLSACLRCLVDGAGAVDVWHSPSTGRARLGGLVV